MDRAVELMRDAKTIAVVGVSSRPDRPSNEVAQYLIQNGYTVYMVNPTETEVLGQPAYDSVRDLPEPVDIVAIAADAKAVWMQLDIVHEEAAAKARAAGLEVVMDKCTKIEHRKL